MKTVPDAFARSLINAPRACLVAFAFVLVLMLLGTPAEAHEFWIEARDYTIAPGEPVVADIKVGQELKGNTYAFNPRRHRRFGIVTESGETEVGSRIGDKPAVSQPVEEEGLAIVVHETTDTELTYKDRGTFETFVTYEGLDGALERHAERGLPDDGFKELYSRAAKALVKVGEGGGTDRALGLPIEVVVEGDPYASPLPEVLPVRVIYGGEPMAGAQLNVFHRPVDGDEGTLEPLRLDAEGRVEVPVAPDRVYLLNVVKLREPSAEKAGETGAVWESLWGSTTFSTGG